VRAERVGNAVYYALTHPSISELLVIARRFLADSLRAQQQHLAAFEGLPPVGGTR
jgi:ArsR family transcriptional regulator